MGYGDYLDNITKRCAGLFDDMSVGYNFDYGVELEIALCHLLRAVLPSRFGICRGFVVSLEGATAGDDIIIFDHDRFPTLRLLESESYARKQRIPVEAVYAYLEIKHTLVVEGDGDNSLAKACRQVDAVKRLPRKQVPLTEFFPGVNFQLLSGLTLTRTEFWPPYWNPMYCGIIARNCITSTTSKEPLFLGEGQKFDVSDFTTENAPDLLIFGNDIVACPRVDKSFHSPFFLPGVTTLTGLPASGKAFAIGLSILSWALDNIRLGTIDWPRLISGALGVGLTEK